MKYGKMALSCLLALVLLAGCGAPEPVDPAPGAVLKGPAPQSVYFAAGNAYYDVDINYLGDDIAFSILTREYVDPESIQVFLDVQSEYDVWVTCQPTEPGLESYQITESGGYRNLHLDAGSSTGGLTFPLYLYQTYAGLDWKQTGQRYADWDKIIALLEEGRATQQEEREALAAYQTLVTDYAEEYNALSLEELPRFYYYDVMIDFSEIVAQESVTEARVRIGQTDHQVPLGHIRLIPTSDYELSDDRLVIKQFTVERPGIYPYGPGVEEVESATWRAEAAVTLTGLEFLKDQQGSLQVLEVTVLLADDYVPDNALEIPWDGETPIYVEKGKYITLRMMVHDPRMQELAYSGAVYPVITYQHEQQSSQICYGEGIQYSYDPWLFYAAGLDGLDMESYFNDYYYRIDGNVWRTGVDLTPWEEKHG